MYYLAFVNDKKMLLNLLLIKYNILINVNITNFNLHFIYLKYNFINLNYILFI